MIRTIRLDSITDIKSENLNVADLSAALRDYLLELPLQGGERIFETQIAKQINVSRQQVREACRNLESEGMLVYTPNRGYSMRILTEREVQQLISFRCVIECAAFAEIAEHKDKTQVIKELRKAYAEIDSAIHTDNAAQQITADLAFHRVIVEMTDNEWLLQAFDRASTQMRYAIRLMSRNLSDFKIYGQSHETLIEYIERGNADEAQKAVREHIKMFLPTLLKRVKA